jgi:hypothetical protein
MRDLNGPRLLERSIALIAWSTVMTGFAQIIRPGRIMRVIGARDTPAGQHMFATVGMFMVVVGGLLLQTLLFDRRASRLVMGWASIQKFGAAAAVAIGVRRGIFSPLALVVAGFDFLSGILIVLFRSESAEPGDRR